MALQSVLEQALGRRRAANRDPREQKLEQIAKQREDVARTGFLNERIDERARKAQPFSLVGKDWFESMGRAEDEAAWEGKTFNLGGKQEGRPAMDPFSPLRTRMKTIEERQADANAGAIEGNYARRADEGSRLRNRGMELRNDALSAGNLEFDLHDDPYHQREHTAIDVERGETMGAHGRKESGLDLAEKLRQFFDPAHQGMLDNLSRREIEPRLEQERIKGMYDVAGSEATARGRVDEARVDATGRPQPAERLLENDTFMTNVIEALSSEALTPQQQQQIALLRQAMSRGGGGGGLEKPQGQPVSRADVEKYAAEKGITYEKAVQEAQAQGFVVR